MDSHIHIYNLTPSHTPMHIHAHTYTHMRIPVSLVRRHVHVFTLEKICPDVSRDPGELDMRCAVPEVHCAGVCVCVCVIEHVCVCV
jgi:hypothetical protein